MMEELLSHLSPRVLCLGALSRSSEAETRRTAVLNTEGKTKVACGTGGAFSPHSLGLAGANTQTVTLTNSLPGEKRKFYKIMRFAPKPTCTQRLRCPLHHNCKLCSWESCRSPAHTGHN